MHESEIKSIQYVDVGDEPVIMTAGYDKNVHIFRLDENDEGEVYSTVVGTLKQGYKTMAKYVWNFKYQNYLKKNPEKRTTIEKKLEEMKAHRGDHMSQRKVKEIELVEKGLIKPKMSTFASVGSQIMGMG